MDYRNTDGDISHLLDLLCRSQRELLQIREELQWTIEELRIVRSNEIGWKAVLDALIKQNTTKKIKTERICFEFELKAKIETEKKLLSVKQ